MNRYFIIPIAFVLLSFNTGIYAQNKVLWSIPLEEELLWQQVRADGSYLLASSSALAAYNQDDGSELWKNKELAGYSEEQIQELRGSVLLVAKQGEDIRVFSPFDGSIKFNSKEAGLQSIGYSSFLLKANSIFIAGKDASDKGSMRCIDNNSGKELWKLEEDFGRIISINEISPDEFLLVTLMQVYKIKSKTGEVVWKKNSSEEMDNADALGIGDAFGGLMNELAKNIQIEMFYKQNLKEDYFVLASQVESKSKTTDGKETISHKNSYTAFRISSGERIWTQAPSYKGKYGDMLFYNQGLIILPDDGKRTTINYHKFENKSRGEWGKKGKGLKIKGGVYKSVRFDDKVLLISSVGSNSFLDILDLGSGETLFKKASKISGDVVGTKMCKQGIAFISTEEVNILNPETGELVLNKSLTTSAQLTALLNEGNLLVAFDTKANLLIKLDLHSGELTDLSSEKLKFKGKENPTKLEVFPEGYVISSEQNIAVFDKEGKLLAQEYYAAPREAGIKRALLYAQAVRAAYISANAQVAAGAFRMAAEQSDDELGSTIGQGIGTAYQELGNQASDFAKKSFQQAQARFKASTEARDFIIMLATVEKTTSLIQVDKKTAQIRGQIDLGKDKNPKYSVDELSNRIFLYKAKDKQIECLQL